MSVSIQVPLFNETEALRFSKFYFDRIGVPAHYVMDRDCSDATRAIVRELGIPEVYFDNDKPFIENGYEDFCRASPTDWILRIDCDEVPSVETIAFAHRFAASQTGIVSFERHQVVRGQDVDGRGSFDVPVAERFEPVNQRQYRLFDRRQVDFNRAIHTPGIHLRDILHAPSEACLYHLSWIFLSWKDRVEKADRYDRFGQPSANRANQLFSIEDCEWKRLPPCPVGDLFKAWMATR